MKRYGLLIAVLLLAFSAPAFAAQNITMCAPSGFTAPSQVQTFTNGTLTLDSKGCVVFDISKDLLGKDMSTFVKAGWDSATRSWLMGSTNAVVSNAVASFFPMSGSGTGDVAATEGDASVIANTVGVIKSLNCGLYTATGVLTAAGGTSYVIAVRQNLADSVVTCTILAAAKSCTDTTHSITTAVLDQLDYGITPNGTPTALVPKCTVEYDTAN